MVERPWFILSLVERGWQAARILSLELPHREFRVLHVVKGWVPRSVRRLVEPKPHVRLASVPRPLFWPGVALLTFGLALRRGPWAVWVDNERSLRRLRRWNRWFGAPVAVVRQGREVCEIWMDGEHVSRAAWQQRLATRCDLR